MNFMAPIKKETSEDIDVYISKCKLQLLMFKQELRNNINKPKLNVQKQKLFKLPCITWLINNPDNINMLQITSLYINSLYCYYDYHECRCYYKVSELIKCPNARNSLNQIIRIMEYGSIDAKPLFWLRKSYIDFIKKCQI